MSYPYRNNYYEYDPNYRKKKKHYDRYDPRRSHNQSYRHVNSHHNGYNSNYNNANYNANTYNANSYNAATSSSNGQNSSGQAYGNDTYYGSSSKDFDRRDYGNQRRDYKNERRHSEGYGNERRIKPAFDIKARLISPAKKDRDRYIPKISDDEEDEDDDNDNKGNIPIGAKQANLEQKDEPVKKEAKEKEQPEEIQNNKRDSNEIKVKQESENEVSTVPEDKNIEDKKSEDKQPEDKQPEDKQPEDNNREIKKQKNEGDEKEGEREKEVQFSLPESPIYENDYSEESDAETVISDNGPTTNNSTKLIKEINPEKSKRPYVLKRDASGSSLLQRACKKGNLEEVKDLIERGASPNESDFCGFTCLHEAALNGNIDIVKYLIKMGADVNKQALPDGDLETPLIDAADNKHLEIVKILLDNGADPRIYNNDGFTALTKIHNLHQDEEGYEEIIKLLEEANIKFLEMNEKTNNNNDNNDKINHSTINNDDDKTELERRNYQSYQKSPSPNTIVEDPNDNYFSEILKKKSQSALIYKYAAEGIKDLTAQYIVEGGRLDYKPDILILAARNGHLELVDIILGLVEDYDIDSTNNVGLSALLASVGRGHFKVVEFLLERGSNPFLRRKQDGLNCLEISSRSANFDIKEIELIEKYMKKNPNHSILSSTSSFEKLSSIDKTRAKGKEKEKDKKRKLSGAVDEKKLKRTKSSDEIKKELKKVKSREESGIKPTTSTLFKREKTPEVETVNWKLGSPSPPPPPPNNNHHQAQSQHGNELNHDEGLTRQISNTSNDKLTRQISNTSNDTPEPDTKEQEELRAKSARDLKLYQEKLEAKKKAKREFFLKAEKEKERKRKEEEDRKIEQEKELKELAIKEEKNKIMKITNEAKKIELAKSKLIKKLINDNYPIGLKFFKFGEKLNNEDILKYGPIYKLKINNEFFVTDLQILLITGDKGSTILSHINEANGNSQDDMIIEANKVDKSKLWNLFAPLIGTKDQNTTISNNLLTEGHEKFQYLSIKLIKFESFEKFLVKYHLNIHKLIFNSNYFTNVDFNYLNQFATTSKSGANNNNSNDNYGNDNDATFTPPSLRGKPNLIKLIKEAKTPLW